MNNVMPSQLANSVMAKFYDVLTNGDGTVPKSADNFFTWCTPAIPVEPTDFEFLTQGFTGVLTKPAVDQALAATGGGTASSSNGASAAGSTAGSSGTATATAAPASGLTPAQIDALLAQDTGRLYMQAENLARLVDFVPEVSKGTTNSFAQLNVQNNEGTLSDIYGYTMTMSEVMQSVLSDDVVQKIAKFRALLTTTVTKTDLVTGAQTQVSQPSPLVEAYTEKMAAYDNAALDYNSHRIDAMSASTPEAVNYWAVNANILRDKVKAAMDDWITNGYKDDYEEIAAFIDQVMARDMSMLKAQYKDDLEKAKLTGIASGSDFYFTSLVPGSFATSDGWTQFGFTSGDFGQSSNSSSNWSTSSGGGGASFMGLFGGSASHSQSSSSSQFQGQFNADNFGLSFEICQVPIVRPWLKTPFLTSKSWRFTQRNPDAKKDILNDGGNPPKGIMQAYPTSVIFVRNLKLTLGESSGFTQWYNQQTSSSTSGGGFVTFGPFIAGGGGSTASGSGQHNFNSGAHWDGQTITVPGMQIVGYRCHILPKSPDPDPSIKAWV
jgi:hypothetical protein